MNELPKDDIEGQISLLKEKLDAFFSFEEAFILILFDLFSPNYKHIQYLMERTGMMDAFRHETLLKVIFRSERISSFQEVFKLHDPLDSFEIFAGYTNQPFNCTNYMNCFLQNKEKQLCLSNILEGKHSHTNILNRLRFLLISSCSYFLYRRGIQTHQQFSTLILAESAARRPFGECLS